MPDLAEHLGLILVVCGALFMAVKALVWDKIKEAHTKAEAAQARANTAVEKADIAREKAEVAKEKADIARERAEASEVRSREIEKNYRDRFTSLERLLYETKDAILSAVNVNHLEVVHDYMRREDCLECKEQARLR